MSELTWGYTPPSDTGPSAQRRTVAESIKRLLWEPVMTAEEAADLSVAVKIICALRLMILVTLFCFPSASLYTDTMVRGQLALIVGAALVPAGFSVLFLVRWDQFAWRIGASWWWMIIEAACGVTLIASRAVDTPVSPLVSVGIILLIVTAGRRALVVAGGTLLGVLVSLLTGTFPMSFNDGTEGDNFRALTLVFSTGAYLLAGNLLRGMLLFQGQATRSWVSSQSREAIGREQIRVAEEVRDQMGKLLTDSLAMANTLAEALQDRPSTAQLARQLVNGLEIAVGESATLFAGLDSPAASAMPTCRSVVDAFARQMPSAVIEMSLEDSVQLAPAVNQELVVALSELLDNVRRHSRATKAHVRLLAGAGSVSLQVSDNGIGLPKGCDLAAFEEAGRVGLVGVRERVARVGGTFDIESGPSGTTTTLVFFTAPRRLGTTTVSDEHRTQTTPSHPMGTAATMDDEHRTQTGLFHPMGTAATVSDEQRTQTSHFHPMGTAPH